MRGPKVGIWPLLSWNEEGLLHPILFFSSITDTFLHNADKIIWKAGLGPLSSGIGAMKTYVELPVVQLLLAKLDFGGSSTGPTPI